MEKAAGDAGVAESHRCRHCYADIRMLPVGAWADDDGFVYCAKFLPHEPLPVGVST
jgi:hypothetical protein